MLSSRDVLFLSLPRQVTKRMNAYIKEKELPKSTMDKRKYVCDAALQELLGVKNVNVFGINK